MLTREEVLKIAKLSSLELTEEEIEKYKSSLTDIIEMVETLNEVDTEGVKAQEQSINLTNVFRKDEEDNHLKREDLLKNAKNYRIGHFFVPKVMK